SLLQCLHIDALSGMLRCPAVAEIMRREVFDTDELAQNPNASIDRRVIETILSGFSWSYSSVGKLSLSSCISLKKMIGRVKALEIGLCRSYGVISEVVDLCFVDFVPIERQRPTSEIDAGGIETCNLTTAESVISKQTD